MEGISFLLYFIPITVVFLFLCGGAAFYCMMGIGQLATGYREKDFRKKKQGWLTVVIAVAVVCTNVYYYLRLFGGIIW